MAEDSYPARRATDGPAIKAHESSQVKWSAATILTGAYCLVKIARTFVVKGKFGALETEDFIMAGTAIQQVAAGIFWLWKRVFRPMNRPIAPGPAAEVVKRITTPTEVPK